MRPSLRALGEPRDRDESDRGSGQPQLPGHALLPLFCRLRADQCPATNPLLHFSQAVRERFSGVLTLPVTKY